MKTFIAAFARNRVFANILLATILLASVLAVHFLVRENFPQLSMDTITITVPYPGADPAEVEEGVSRKLEEAVEGVEGIKQYTTHSSEGEATAQIEVLRGYDVSEVLDRVRSKVEAISTFPKDAEKPIISEVTFKDSVLMLALSGDMPERRLKEWADRFKDELEQLPGISQVEVSGVRDYEISIEVSEPRLQEYGLTFDQVVQAVNRSDLNMPGGTIRSQGEEIRIRTINRKYTGKELADVVVLATPGGEVVTLDKIAVIRDGFADDPIQARANGKPAAVLNVMKTEKEDALAISKAVKHFLAEKKASLPAGVSLDLIYDSTGMLRDRIDLLVSNGIMGLVLVFFLLWIFLDGTVSFWVAIGIPVALGGTMAVLWMMGETINMISLFGMIMVLGMVVDDATVIGEAIYYRRQQGEPPLKAAVEGVAEVGLPVIAASTTTVMAFLPLAFIGGVMGKFIRILPVVVISSLMVSLAECFFLFPSHLSHLPGPEEQNRRRFDPLKRLRAAVSRGLEWFVERVYTPFLRTAIGWRYIFLSSMVALLLITIGFIESGMIKFEVFPEIDGFILMANVEYPNGTPPDVTMDGLKRIDAALTRVSQKVHTKSGEPLVLNRLTMLGQSVGEYAQTRESGPNLGGMYAILLPSERRGIAAKDLEAMWQKELGALPGAKSVTFQGMSSGPPGAPIEIWLEGRSIESTLAASEDLMARLNQFDGVYQVRSDYSRGKDELRLDLKPGARALGLTVEDLARQVYAGYYGAEAVRLQRGKDDIRVKVRYTEKERSRLSDFERIRIRTPQGSEVPLISVADIHMAPGYSTIIRTDGMRRVAVSAAVDTNRTNAGEVIAELKGSYFGQLRDKYPGVYVNLQGEQQRARESFDSLKVGFPLGLAGIFVIIATMFRSYLQPLIIMFTVPFGIIGAILGHLLLGYDLSLLSIFGMVALAGVVVNDAIVLIERVNENMADGMSFKEAIVRGGTRRFRAILLTTLTTVGGLAPLIAEKNLQAEFLIPMALSLAAGVAFATLLTLVLVPDLLVILNDCRRAVYRLKYGRWPAPEEVEPAVRRREDLMPPPLKLIPIRSEEKTANMKGLEQDEKKTSADSRDPVHSAFFEPEFGPSRSAAERSRSAGGKK